MSTVYPTSTTTSARSTLSRRKWFVDLQMRKQERLAVVAAAATTTTAVTTSGDSTSLTASGDLLLTPVGYSEQKVADYVPQEDDDRLLARRSWGHCIATVEAIADEFHSGLDGWQFVFVDVHHDRRHAVYETDSSEHSSS